MDLGSLNNTRKLSQDVLDNMQRVGRVFLNENRRILFIEHKTDARRSIARHLTIDRLKNPQRIHSQRSDFPTDIF